MESLQTYRRLLVYVKPYGFRLGMGMLAGWLFAAINGATVVLVKEVLGKVFAFNRDLSASEVIGYALMMPAVFLVRGIFAYINGYLMNWVGLKVVMDLRNGLFAHLQELSLNFHNQSRIGDLISRIVSDCDVVRRSVSTSLSDLLREPMNFIFLIGALFWLDWKFSLGFLVLFPTCIVPVAIFGRKVKRATRRTQHNFSELISILHENFTAVRIVKAFCMEKHEARKFADNTHELIRQSLRVVRATEMLTPLIEFISAIAIGIAFLYAYKTSMTAETFVALAFGMFSLYNPAKKLSRVHLTLQQSAAAAERVLVVFDRQPSILNKPGAKNLPPLRDRIVYENVSFRYESKPVLDSVSFEVPAGTVLAIVGATGSGKTTIVNLLPRFYDVVGGRITIDGHDVRDVTLESLRQQIAIVTQETLLFDDTVANNIAYGKLDATREEIIDAARRAHADDFIRTMPQGYDSRVGDKGVRISGGERQRLAIARALLKNSPLLILDEATSALDTQTEQHVQAAIDELMRGRTVFAIAHRLSTVQHAHRILVLEDGRIVESGTHTELHARGGVYRRLHDLQFKV